MSSYNRLKFKENYIKIGEWFPQKYDVEKVLTDLENIITNKMKNFLEENRDKYKIRKIVKDTFLLHSANLSNFESNIDKIDENELNAENRDLFELNMNDPLKRREGSTSFTYNNNNYYLSKNQKSMEMSMVSVYSGVKDIYLGRLLMYRNKDELNVLDILDYDLNLDIVQKDHSQTYTKRILFNIYVYNYFIGDISNMKFDYDPGLQYLQRLIYYIFELYAKKRGPSDPKIDGLLLLDGTVDPLLWKNEQELYFIPGIEVLIFSPEKELILESLYYIKDNILIYDINTWKEILEKRILKELIENPKKNEYKNFNIDEYKRLNVIINNYANKCRNIYLRNDMYNPLEKLKGKTFKMDTECSCMIVKNIKENISKKKYIQTNKQPLLTNTLSGKNEGRYDINKQNKAFVTQEVCLKDMSEDYMVPKKPNNTLRIMTYNVHYWQGPRDKNEYNVKGKKRKHLYNGDEIVNVIHALDPDILGLQEVMNIDVDNDWGYINWTEISDKLKLIGYELNNSFCGADNDYFGNMLIHKNTIKMSNYRSLTYNNSAVVSGNNEKGKRRCAIICETEINNTNYSIYCIHLDDTSRLGRNEFTDLIAEDMKKNINKKILMGDFNSYRSDYPYQKLKSINMNDCYSHKNLIPPSYTTWTGTEIDYIMVDNDLDKDTIMGCFTGHTPLSDHLPIIMDIKIGNSSYDGTFIRLPYDSYENIIMTNYEHELNTIPEESSWFKYIKKNMLNEEKIDRNNVELPTSEILSKFTLVDRIPLNKLIGDTEILKKKNIIKYLNPTKLKIILYSQKKPLYIPITRGANLRDDKIYELIDNSYEPIPCTWYYGNTNTSIGEWGAGGFIYPGTTYKIGKELLMGFLNNNNLKNDYLIKKIYTEENRMPKATFGMYDIFIRFEDISLTNRWISTHALCYSKYAEKYKLLSTISNTFDKIFNVKIGLYPLNSNFDYSDATIPINTTIDTPVHIHPVDGSIAFSPHDKQSFNIKDKTNSIYYVSIVDNINVDGEELLDKPVLVLHVYGKYDRKSNRDIKEIEFIDYIDTYINTNQQGGKKKTN